MNFYEAIKNRRSNYDITNSSIITNERIEEILKECVKYVPSAFHSQSSRVVLLFGEKHAKLWAIVLEKLKKIVPQDKFDDMQKKINGFAAGHGTVLFFEDMATVSELQKAYPNYAENFPIWSYQSGGMLQFAFWTAISSENLGASLQHYNPLIDADIAQEFDIPANWKLLAQMPFGDINNSSEPPEYGPIEDRIKILGGNKTK